MGGSHAGENVFSFALSIKAKLKSSFSDLKRETERAMETLNRKEDEEIKTRTAYQGS